MADVILPGLIGHTVAALAGAPQGGGLLVSAVAGGDTVDGGPYHVTGTVAIDSTPDIPVHRKVRLFDAKNGRLVREAWSDAVTGAYAFEGVRLGPWLVVAHDYTNSYNAVVADNILAVPM